MFAVDRLVKPDPEFKARIDEVLAASIKQYRTPNPLLSLKFERRVPE